MLQPNDLTAREAQVLQLVACGMTDKEIARYLRISSFTVSNHLRNMSRKAGGARRTALVASFAQWAPAELMASFQGPMQLAA